MYNKKAADGAITINKVHDTVLFDVMVDDSPHETFYG
jgi:hypothetical protein